VCRIIADVFERRSGVVDLLSGHRVEVEIRALRAGDYALPGDVLVERKTVSDLHESIVRGRFWPQLGKLRRGCKAPYLIVEGRDLDAGPLQANAVRGACLASVAQGIRLLRSEDRADSARWIAVLAVRADRRRRARPPYAQRLKPVADEAGEAMLAAVPGISVELARRLLSRFGSPADVFAAGSESWLRIPGMGPTRAEALERALRSNKPTNHSSPRARNG
jgi:ERCC4-type nuclease